MIVKIYRTVMVCLIVASLLLISYWMGTVLEMTLLMVAFLYGSNLYRFKYHCKSSFQCLLVSVCVMVAAVRISLPITQSYVSAGLVGVTVAYCAQYLAELKFVRQQYAETLAVNSVQRVYAMNEMELRAHCRKFLLDPIDEEIVIQRLVYKLKGQCLYDKIGYSKPQMIRREKHIETKLNIRLK